MTSRLLYRGMRMDSPMCESSMVAFAYLLGLGNRHCIRYTLIITRRLSGSILNENGQHGRLFEVIHVERYSLLKKLDHHDSLFIHSHIYRWLGREGRQQQKWTFDLTYALRLVEIPNTQNGWFSFLCHCIILHGYFDQVPRSPFNKNGMFVMGWFSIDWFVWPIWCYFEDYLCLAICKHKGHKNIFNNFLKKSLYYRDLKIKILL